MTTHRTFGTWLVNYEGSGRIKDLRDDFVRDTRGTNLKPRHFKTAFDLYDRIESQACQDALDTLEEAAIRYGQPLPDEDEREQLIHLRRLNTYYKGDQERIELHLAKYPYQPD